MGLNLIALAIPFFFLLIGIEIIVARRQGRRSYRFADAIAAFQRGLAITPGNDFARLELSTTARRGGEFLLAETEARTVAERLPGFALAHATLGLVQLDRRGVDLHAQARGRRRVRELCSRNGRSGSHHRNCPRPLLLQQRYAVRRLRARTPECRGPEK